MNVVRIMDKRFITNAELEQIRNSSEVVSVAKEDGCIEYNDYEPYRVILDDDYFMIVYVLIE